MGDLTKQAQLLKKCVKLAVYIRSGREFVSILTMQPNNVLEKGAFFGRVSEQGKQYMIRRMIVKSGATSRPFISKWKNRAS